MNMKEIVKTGGKLVVAAGAAVVGFEVAGMGAAGAINDGKFVVNLIDDKVNPAYMKKGMKYYQVSRATGRITRTKDKKAAKAFIKAQKEVR